MNTVANFHRYPGRWMQELVGALESSSVVPHGAEEDEIPSVTKGLD